MLSERVMGKPYKIMSMSEEVKEIYIYIYATVWTDRRVNSDGIAL